MNYLGNDRNIVRDAALTATNLVPSGVVYRSDTTEKAGGGLVALSGSFTGSTDSTFEIEALGSASATARVSAPVFSGVGNGALTGQSATALANQTFTIALSKLGTRTAFAQSPFQGGVKLVARSSGSAGNNITLTVSRAALVETATSYATQGAITAEQNEYIGDEWKFGAVPHLTPEGRVPSSAPRIRFGVDPQVYRAYREFKNGRSVYSFSPAPVRDVPAGVPVYTITGGYTLTITNGTTTQVLPTSGSIVSLYDALLAIRTYAQANPGTALIDVDGVPVDNHLPGGHSATELSIQTTPYLVADVREGSDYIRQAKIGLTLGVNVPTEKLSIRCIDARTPGSEVFSVTGEVSKALANARTGVAYNAGGYAYTIPTVPYPAGSSAASITVQFRRPEQNESVADVGFRCIQPVLGANAKSGNYIFVFKPRPPTGCTTAGAMNGGPSEDCLGITPPEDTQMSAAQLLSRRQRLARYVRTFVQSNTSTVASSAAESVDQDISYMNRAALVFDGTLTALSATIAVLEPAGWIASTPYAQDQQVTATVAGVKYRFVASVPGTSGGVAPAWSATYGASVTDNSVTWKNHGKVSLALWDEAMDLLEADAAQLLGLRSQAVGNVASWAASTAFAVGNIISVATVNNVFGYYRCSTAGSTAATQPAWANAVAIGSTLTDGTVVWTRHGGDSVGGVDALDEAYIERYVSAMNEVRAAAGLSANFDFASDTGDGCWRDNTAEPSWFEYSGDDPYAPIVPGVYYHSSLLETREDGTTGYFSTKEFGLGAAFGCPSNLRKGDYLVVTIVGAQGVPTYQVGDLIEAQVTRAVPLEFGGGQTGDNLLTWTVTGSVSGGFANYAQNVAVPNSYSSGGLAFTIAEGAIKFALGDTFTFSVESGQWRWRKNAGAWSGAADITAAPVALSDGLSANFTGGKAPSWVAGDLWKFTAEAIYGPDRVRQPTDGRLTWTTSQTLTITPTGTLPIGGILLAEHSIPSTAVITLQGSDDNFATTPLSQVVPWRAGSIWLAITATRAKYRLTVNQAGSVSYLWLGQPLAMTLSRTGAAELGLLTKRYRLPGSSTRAGLGGQVTHTAVSPAAVTSLLAMLEHACNLDDRRFAVVPNSTQAEAALVEYQDDTLEVDDTFGYQTADPNLALLNVALEMAPIP